MQQVWKYRVNVDDYFTLELPKFAEILTVQVQAETPCLWALVDAAAEKEPRTFRLAGTGHPINEVNGLRYINTFQMVGGRLVFHLFEVTKAA